MNVLPVARGVAWRTVHNALTTPSILLPTFMFPLFFFTAFAGGLSQVSHVPGFTYAGNYTAFQFAFVLLQAAAFGGVFTGFGVARDFEGGFAKRLLVAAPNRTGIVVGYAVAAFIRWALVATLLTAVGLASGMDVGASPRELVGLYSLAVFVNLAGFLWSCGIAMRFRTIQAAPLMQMPTFLILFLAPVYVPLDLLEGWIAQAAAANPITYVLEAERGLLAGTPDSVALAYGIGAALAAVAAVWAMRGLRRAEAAG